MKSFQFFLLSCAVTPISNDWRHENFVCRGSPAAWLIETRKNYPTEKYRLLNAMEITEGEYIELKEIL